MHRKIRWNRCLKSQKPLYFMIALYCVPGGLCLYINLVICISYENTFQALCFSLIPLSVWILLQHDRMCPLFGNDKSLWKQTCRSHPRPNGYRLPFTAKPFSYKHSTCKQERCSYTWFYIRGWAKKTLCPVIVNLWFLCFKLKLETSKIMVYAVSCSYNRCIHGRFSTLSRDWRT
jgi:hypothetical protein